MRRASAESDEYAGRAGAHEVQRCGVGRGATDDDGNVELVDEALEVQRLGPAGDVFGRDGRAADDEEVATGFHHGLPELLGALRRERAGHRDTGLTHLAEPLGDQLGLDRRGIDLLQARGRGGWVERGDLGQQERRVVVARP